MPGRPDMCFPVWSVRLSYRFAHVYPTPSPRSSTRWGTACSRSWCEVASPAGPPPTTRTSTPSVTGDRQIPPDPLGHAVREAHDRQVGVDLERVGEEARVRHPEPGETVHASPGVGHRVGCGPSHPAAAHEMSGGDGQHTGPEMAGGHALFETIGVGGLEERRVGRRMYAPCPGGEEDAGGCAGPPHQAIDGLGREAVVHDRAPRP